MPRPRRLTARKETRYTFYRRQGRPRVQSGGVPRTHLDSIPGTSTLQPIQYTVLLLSLFLNFDTPCCIHRRYVIKHRAPHVQRFYSVINSSLDRPRQLSILKLSYSRMYLPSLYRPSQYPPCYRRFKTINRSINSIQSLRVKSSSLGDDTLNTL